MPGLIRGVARTAVVAGTATAVSNRVSRRQASKWAAQEQPAYQEPPPQQYAPQEPAYQQPAPPPEEDESITKIQKLAELHTQGALTDEEFAAAKAQILGI